MSRVLALGGNGTMGARVSEVLRGRRPLREGLLPHGEVPVDRRRFAER